MALQGNLRDFSATEILQLLGSQKKTGCLILESGPMHAVVYVQDGRIVSTRSPGMAKDDTLISFLRRVHRLTDEQVLGLTTIHQESKRDLEDLLVNGRYVEHQDITAIVERQILDTLMTVMAWPDGAYRFDPNQRWDIPSLVRLSMDGVLIEIARRVDEEKRYAKIFYDPNLLMSVRDLPDPDEPFSEEETELLGLVDGRRTVAEIVEAAPLSPFEARDALNRMLEAAWIEFSGRREGAPPPGPAVAPVPIKVRRWAGKRSFLRELLVTASVAAAVLALRFGAHLIEPSAARSAPSDVFAATTLRDLRFALELYRRERGTYPERLAQLVDDRWIAPDQARLTGFVLHYRVLRAGGDYQLELVPDR
jgi:hypothetical protein